VDFSDYPVETTVKPKHRITPQFMCACRGQHSCRLSQRNIRECSMRSLIRFPSDGPTTQFRCINCAWVFPLKKPLTVTNPLAAHPKMVQRKFDAHNCIEFPFMTSVRCVIRRVSRDADTYRIEQYMTPEAPPRVQIRNLFNVEHYLQMEQISPAHVWRLVNELRESGHAEFTISVR
jgi:hypothetical protein